jgi:two-component system response regulator YesN
MLLRSKLKQVFEEIGHRLKHPNRFCHYLLSYMLIVVVLLLMISSVVYGSFIAVIEKEAERSTINQLQQIKEMMDTRMREMDRIALQITLNPLLSAFMVSQDGYGMYSAVNELKKYRSSNEFLQDVALYYMGSDADLLYASSGTYKARNYVKASDHALRKRGMSRDIDGNGRLVYVYPLPESYGVILFQIKEQELGNMIRNALGGYRGFIYILDDQGRLVMGLSDSDAGEKAGSVFELVKHRSDAAADAIVLDGRPHFVLPITSDLTGWSYIAVLDQEQILSKVNETRGLFGVTAAAVLVIGMMMAVMFSIRNYRPIRKLAKVVHAKGTAHPLSKRGDELDVITEAFDLIAKENESLSAKLKSQAGLLKERYILALLDGKLTGQTSVEALRFASGLKLDKPYFAVLLFLIDDYDAFTRSYSPPMQNVLKYSFVKMLEDLAENIGHGFGVEYLQQRGVALLLNMDAPEQDLTKRLIAMAEKAVELFKQFYRLTVTVGIGGVQHEIALVHKSFAQADYALRHKLVKGAGKVISYHEVKQTKENMIWYPLDLEKQLVQAMKQGNAADAEILIRQMMKTIASQPISIEQVEYICFDMINTVIKTSVEMNIPLMDADETVERMFSARFETFSELAQLMIDYCAQICHYLERLRESRNRDLLERLKNYVLEHYADPTISLETIADEFGFSASYVTRYFKHQTGQSLKHFIDEIRMEKAKELLIHSDKTLGEIVQTVGYVDPTNFIRKFKKIEGLTPIQYRTMLQSHSLSFSK